MQFYAHSIAGAREDDWEPLGVHLSSVGALAASHAAAFDSAAWGKLVGLWHDLGKYRPAFQARLRDDTIRAEHAIVGAALAHERGGYGGLLAFVIAGHHGGLPNRRYEKDCRRRPLKERLEEAGSLLEEVRGHAPTELLQAALPDPPAFLRPKPGEPPKAAARRAVLWTRFIFSALVDADYLATEAFLDPGRAGQRRPFDSIEDLGAQLTAHIDSLVAGAEATPVNAIRAEILSACRAAATTRPGVFSLAVPTGGGKTLSGMDFALRHAAAHGLRRVIVVLPYTSIIEQNAKVYRDALGVANVLEHHANLTRDRRRETVGEEVTKQHERAEENWAAPVVVTTSVQFLESLYANGTSWCRKLHNVVGSVVILDEVQTLPPSLLLPILEALNALVTDYGCSLVLSTATPPALTRRESLTQGLPEAHPIIPDPAALGARLRRVRYHWPESDASPVVWDSFAKTLAAHEQVLAIVDRRADAYELAVALGDVTGDRVYHLSALMCPAHRLEVIEEIRTALKDGAPCHVVSTQLIEAGVDLDFPVVYRAMAGLDRIVQAAGRCNREGKQAHGEVHVFHPPKEPPPGEMRTARHCTEAMLAEGPPNVEDPATFDRFFRALYGRPEDERQVLQASAACAFETVARNVKLIDDKNQVTVACPFGEGEVKLHELRTAMEAGYVEQEHYRALQPFVVQVYTRQAGELVREGILLTVTEGLYELAVAYAGRYDRVYGLLLGTDAQADASAFVV